MTLPLFDGIQPRRINPIDPTVTAPERKRLTGQSEEILARLLRGPATNRELAGISLNYRARISDLRAAGFSIVVSARNYESGLNTYQLEVAK